MSENNTRIDEMFKHYRLSGVGLSATLIALSSGLLWWLNEVATKESVIMIRSQIIVLGVVIISSLAIQVFNYLGYKCHSRAYFGQSTKSEADQWFSKEDISVYISVYAFSVEIVLLVIYFIAICLLRTQN